MIWNFLLVLVDDRYGVVSGCPVAAVYADTELEARRAILTAPGLIRTGLHPRHLDLHWCRTPEEYAEDPLTAGYFRKVAGSSVLEFVPAGSRP